MVTEASLHRSQWFFDNKGYYAYVLLNASEEWFKKIQQVLKSNGLRVSLAGKSYRPASNGVQYQWYIRVADEDGKHPQYDRIQTILSSYEIPKINEAVTGTETRIAAYEIEIKKLKAFLVDREQRLTLARRQYQELQANYGRIKQDIENYRQRVRDLEAQLIQIQESVPKPEVDRIRHEYDEVLHALRQELAEKEKELAEKDKDLASWIDNFEPEIRDRDERIRELENQIASLEKDKEDLLDQMQKIREIKVNESGPERPEYIFKEIIHILLPNVELLGGTFDTLWYEMKDPLKVIRTLPQINQLKGKRIQKTRDWLEKHIDEDWRLYYRNCGNSQYQVYISHKKNQKMDIEWLCLQ